MGAALTELFGLLVLGFLIFLFVAGPLAIIAAGLLFPVLMPVAIPCFIVFAILANLGRKYHDWLDSM